MLKKVLLAGVASFMLGCTSAQPQPAPPSPDFTFSPFPSNPVQQVTFDWTGSCSASPCSFVWEDEGPDGPGGTDYPWGTGDPLVKAFPDPGTKYAHLVVTDSLGRTAELRMQHRVQTAPPPSGGCDLNATPANFAAQVSAATAGQTLCLASGSYGTWRGTSKQITIKAASGATPTMRYSFGSGDSNFTLDGMSGMGGSSGDGVANVTVKNSVFTSCVSFDGAQTNVVFDNNSHNNIDATCSNTRIRLGASGVTVRNSEMIGGDTDGTFVTSSGFLFENNHVAPCEDPATPNHTDGLQYADPGDLSGGYAGVVRRNYFDGRNCPGVQMLTSYDGGTNGALWEDNVIDTTRNWGIELYSDEGSTVRHNTVRWYPSSQCTYTGLQCGLIDVTHKPVDPPSTGTQVYENVAIPAIDDDTTGESVHHNVSGQLVTYVGPLSTWAGFHLADGSLGENAASDGLDLGIR